MVLGPNGPVAVGAPGPPGKDGVPGLPVRVKDQSQEDGVFEDPEI